MNIVIRIWGTLISRPPFYVMAIFLLFMLLVPVMTDDLYLIGVLVLANVYAIFASSWDILSGYSGKENFGHTLFIGAGAYGAAYLNLYLGVPPMLNLLLCGLIGAIFGVLIGIPCLPLVFYTKIRHTYRVQGGAW